MSVLARAQITIIVINDGPTGPTGKRMLTGMVHYQLSNASAPAKPSATAFNFATRIFSGLTANWAIDSPVYASGNANKYWYCTYTVEESTSGSGTGTPVFGTVKQAIGFSGLVTFTGDQSVTDGTKTLSFGATGTTKIDGGNIETGTVSADRIDVDNLVVKQAVIGKIQDVAGPLASTAKSEAISAAAALDDAIQVGGRNYILESLVATQSNFTTGFDSKGKWFQFNIGVRTITNLDVFEAETSYVLSFEYVSVDGSGAIPYFRIRYTDGTFSPYLANIHSPYVTNANKTVRTVETTYNTSGVVRVYNLKFEKGNKATDWTPAPEDVQAAIDANASALSDFEGAVTTYISGLQAQIDGVFDSWFYDYTPTTVNYPASEWTTTELKQGHIGDTFTNTQAYVDEATTPDAGKSWRWVESSGVYSWTPIADSDAVKALLAASAAQDTADGKRRVFTTTPTPPYDKDDLWSGGSSGDLKISTTSRAAGSSYVAGDWVLATKYTDDTAANAAAAAAAAAQSAADDASTAASNAQTSANTANNLLSDIANDNKFTPLEKQETKKEWDAIVSEKTKNDSQADTFGVSKTAYGTAYTALSNYITPLLSSLTTTSDITGTTFRSTFKAYYDARTDLLNAIAAKARTLANTAQTTADNAANAASAAVTTAASDATSKMNAAKDDIAKKAGYTNFTDMASNAALTVNGLLNSNIINTDQIFADKLLAFSAFIDNLTVRKLLTPIDSLNARVEIKEPTTADPYARITILGADASSIWSTYARMFVESAAESGQNSPSAALEVRTVYMTAHRKWARVTADGFVSLLDVGLDNPATMSKHSGTHNYDGMQVEYKPSGGVYTVKIKLMYNSSTSTIEFVLDGLPTANPGGSVTVWKDSKGFLRIGAAVAYTAADVGAVPTSRTVNNKALSADISLTAADVGAVPTSQTVNNKALSADISLTAADVGAVSTSRKVNSKALSADITLSAADVGALPTNTIQYFTQAQWAALTQEQKDAVPLALVQE